MRIPELLGHVAAEFVVFDQHRQEMVAGFKTAGTKGNAPMREGL